MCGISVLYKRGGLDAENYSQFLRSLEMIAHRGPDDEGVLLVNTSTGALKAVRTSMTHPDVQGVYTVDKAQVEGFDLALGHRRLSIVDLSPMGHQPMMGQDGSWVVFNGEIYNYVELREELKTYGCHFKTTSDTEVILEAYRTWGTACLDRFNGMWGICIWDAPNRKLFISNDRFGVKPLYFTEQNGTVMLASEIKQFKAIKTLTLSINQKHFREFLDFGFIDMDNETVFSEVHRFAKSHYILLDPVTYSDNALAKGLTPYYRIRKHTVPVSEKKAIEAFRELFYSAVRLRMRMDVDFGFALSGGLDSSSMLYMARNVIRGEKMPNNLLGFSAVFPGYPGLDESAFVKIVENDLPCKTYYSFAMEEFNIREFEEHLYHQDEPLQGTSYFAQWSTYRKAHAQGIKVLFNGQGADEVFGGYHHHFYRYCRQLLMSGRIIQYFSLVRKYAELKNISPKTIHSIVFNEVKLSAAIKLGIAGFDHAVLKHWNKMDTLDEMLVADFETFQLPRYLRADDRNSMAFSIESRHPFMDYRLVEFGYSLPNDLLIKNGWQKYIMRAAMHEMPESIRYRKDKVGFITPQDVWMKKYHAEFEEYLSYNEQFFGERKPSKTQFYNYSLGAWLKRYQAV